MLLTCTSCEGFVPKNAAACPHCGTESLDVQTTSKLSGLVKGLATAATGGLVAVTLMACYGGPGVENSDFDGDGFGRFQDCNDNDASINPGANDPLGDGIDQNCDGVDGVTDGGVESAGAGGGDCVTCIQAVNMTGLVAPSEPFCTTAGEQAFDALKACACTDCKTDCESNICAGGAATSGCSTCVMSTCSTQNLDCSEN
jgi:hypothetical protein